METTGATSELEGYVSPEREDDFRKNRSMKRPYIFFLAGLSLAIMMTTLSLYCSSAMLRFKDGTRGRNWTDTSVKSLRSGVVTVESLRNNSDAGWAWENAGGKFGLSADWRVAVVLPGDRGDVGSPSRIGNSSTKSFEGYGERDISGIRGKACLTQEKQEEVRQILDRRKNRPPGTNKKVAACVRSKDFGRFLPEWVAYHYAVGVDEMVVIDDDSIDGTEEILEPFVKAGIVTYQRTKLSKRSHQMKPLNDCLKNLQKRKEIDPTAPSWLLLHDTDEYLFPGDQSLSISEAMQTDHGDICCLFVNRVQYGSAGYQETPAGLMLENFLTHATEDDIKINRLWKVVINLDPSSPELGVVKAPLPSMHGVNEGCKCRKLPLSEMRINHYLGSRGDFMDKTRRYWQENHSVDKVEVYLESRDVNVVESDAIKHWACATREVLARVAEGLDMETGEPLPATRK